MEQYRWLKHIETSLPDSAKGYTINSYSIMLEAWRRGLQVTFHKTNRTKSNATYVIEDLNTNRKHKFIGSMGDLVKKEAIKACIDKHLTKEYLERAKVPTPKGVEFIEKDSDEFIINNLTNLQYPLVVKPTKGTGGNGVITGIKNSAELKKALRYVREELNFPNVVVEEYFEGEDYRIYVVGDEAIAVTNRYRANIVGDGKLTIKELIKEKNIQRKNNPILGSSPIKIDQELKDVIHKVGYSLNTIPKKGERVVLKSKNNVSAGGDPVDLTEDVPKHVKQTAVDACKAIPNLPHAGVDIMFNKDTEQCTIIEINSRPTIRTHLFPMEGTARDIPKKIIDLYFPETRQNIKSPLYFDYGVYWNKLKKHKLNEIQIPNHPQGELISKRLIIRQNMKYLNYGKWVQRQATIYNMYGYIKHLNNNSTAIIIVGREEDMNKFINKIKNPQEENYYIDNKVEVKERHRPVLNVFYIDNIDKDISLEEGYHPIVLKVNTPVKKKKSIKSKKNKSISKSKNKNSKKASYYKKEYEKIVDSTSWKITKPLRKISSKLRKK